MYFSYFSSPFLGSFAYFNSVLHPQRDLPLRKPSWCEADIIYLDFTDFFLLLLLYGTSSTAYCQKRLYYKRTVIDDTLIAPKKRPYAPML